MVRYTPKHNNIKEKLQIETFIDSNIEKIVSDELNSKFSNLVCKANCALNSSVEVDVSDGLLAFDVVSICCNDFLNDLLSHLAEKKLEMLARYSLESISIKVTNLEMVNSWFLEFKSNILEFKTQNKLDNERLVIRRLQIDSSDCETTKESLNLTCKEIEDRIQYDFDKLKQKLEKDFKNSFVMAMHYPDSEILKKSYLRLLSLYLMDDYSVPVIM